ncbi:Uu.00g131500.m01.CDS01 [Anthostomella pinea]|uniref:Uu.00g131500.m01.CDS01 n=1 Tax=Anthostomella pinea TaxID=933095 RepID=A0AAI8VJL9_9PEZI|nr:Uu.00g131500.m01.CDS01 [Anthostomella pinea]
MTEEDIRQQIEELRQREVVQPEQQAEPSIEASQPASILSDEGATETPLPAPTGTKRKASKTLSLTAATKKTKASNTDYEKVKGNSLNSDEIGCKATQPCDRCRDKSRECRVALDPGKPFNSFKCGHCISQKLSCSFSATTPGIDYPPNEERDEKEKKKKESRKTAAATLETKKKLRNANEIPDMRSPSAEASGSGLSKSPAERSPSEASGSGSAPDLGPFSLPVGVYKKGTWAAERSRWNAINVVDGRVLGFFPATKTQEARGVMWPGTMRRQTMAGPPDDDDAEQPLREPSYLTSTT